VKGSQTSIAKGSFGVFGLLLIVINLAVTYQFGNYFLDSAFGIQNAAVASIVGGLYAVLFLDVAYLVWLGLYLRGGEQTTNQRAIAGVGALVGFIGSLMATLYMLIQGTSGSLAVYANSIETVAQVVMIVVVAVNIILAIAYVLSSRDERVKQTAIASSSSATEKALAMATTNVDAMIPQLASQISAQIENQIYASLNFKRSSGGNLEYTAGQRVTPPTSARRMVERDTHNDDVDLVELARRTQNGSGANFTNGH
jgi:hypothetical protein